ncbi:hypothetical protein MTO96_018420 [Rhipicephalus appendiculatus]
MGFVPARDDSTRSVDSVFTYPETKVAAYLSTLPDMAECPRGSGTTDDIETMTGDLAITGLVVPQARPGKPATPTLPAIVVTADMPEKSQGDKEVKATAFSLPTIPETAEVSDNSRTASTGSIEQPMSLDLEGPVTRSRRKRPTPDERNTVQASLSDDGSDKSEPNTKKLKTRSTLKSAPGRKQR